MIGKTSLFHKSSLWIMKALYLNVLWICFSLIGLVIFGIGPATIALFVTIRKLFRNEEVSIFSTFTSVFKSTLLKGNILFLFYSFLALICYFDINYFSRFDGFIYNVITSVFVILAFFLFVSFCFIGPIFSHYRLSFTEYIKVSFLVPFIIPLEMIGVLIGLFICTLLFTFLPGFIPFLCVSLPGFIITYFAQKGFERWAKKSTIEEVTG